MKGFLLFCAVLIALGGATLRYTQWDTYLWHHWNINRQVTPADALDLSRYRVDIEAVALEGVDDDLSALAFNDERNTLFGLVNGQPDLLEISLEGKLLRRVRIEGVRDMEGMAHIGGDRYVIAEERHQRLRIIELPDGVQTLDVSNSPRLTIAIDDSDNLSFEGLSWNASEQKLLLVRERDPLRVLVVEGFVNGDGDLLQVDITEKARLQEEDLFVSDLSAVEVDNLSGNLLLLSDESQMVVEYAPGGKAISLLGLRRGFHGLQRSVPQAEGMALDNERRLYIVSEPNLFYRFSPVEP